MRAAQLTGYSQDFEIGQVPDPVLMSPTDVIVKVGAAGFCRTDVHLWLGQLDEMHKTAGIELPFVCGHESAGWVVEVGSAVTHVQVGDAVLLHPLATCGYCLPCRAGDDAHCTGPVFPGIAAPGGFAEYVRSNARAVVPIPEGLTPVDVAPLADAGTWDDAAEQLFDRLLEQYLRVHHPLLYALLRAAGCIDYQAQVPTGALRVPYTRVVLDWDQLGALFDHPLSALERAYHWNDPDTPFDHARLLGNLAAVLRTLGLSTSPIIPSLQLGSGLDAQTQASVHQDVDGLRVKLLQGLRVGQHLSYEVGADLFPGGPDPSAVPTGLVLRPRLLGSLSESVALGASLAVTTTVAADIGAALALELFPGATRLAGSVRNTTVVALPAKLTAAFPLLEV